MIVTINLKTLFLLENILNYRIFIREYSHITDEVVIICENADIQSLLDKQGFAFKTKYDYLSNDELKEITDISMKFMDTWFCHGNSTLYKNIHLGSLYAMDYGFFEKIISYIEKISKAIEKESPSLIIVPACHQLLTEDIIKTRQFKFVRCHAYRLNPFEKLIDRIINNPYYQYLKKSANFRLMINEIRDYLSLLPKEFRMRGKNIHKIKRNSVLVTVIHRNEVQICANPVRELEKRGYEVIFFVIDSDGGGVLNKLKAEGFKKFIRAGDLFNERYKYLYGDIRNQFKTRWINILNDPGFWHALIYKGIPVLKYANREKLKWMVTKLSPFWAIIYEMIISDLLKNMSIKSVIAMNDMILLGRTTAFAAFELSIPSIDIQHGMYISIPVRSIATKWCVWSEAAQKQFIDRGFPNSKLEVTGNPAFDTLISAGCDADNIMRKLQISHEFHYIITWAPSAEWIFSASGEDYNEKIFYALQQLACDQDTIMFIFKPHPSERVRRFERMLQRSLKNMMVVSSMHNIHEVLYISDILMTWNSSVVTEAVIYDKPIIGLNFFGFEEKVPCVSSGIALEARDPVELKKAIDCIRLNKDNIRGTMKTARERYIKDYLYKADGKASERIVDTLEELMQERKPVQVERCIP